MCDVRDLDLREDKALIIHQTLRYGNLAQLRWLFETYSEHTIREVFVSQPSKIYDGASLRFVCRILLNISEQDVSSYEYLSSTPRHPR